LLRELLGQAELRELIDPAVVDEVEAELQGLADSRKARHADALHDLLRRVGDLNQEEIDARTDGNSSSWLEGLEVERRAVLIRIAGENRWIAAEDTPRYRDGLGILPPSGLPDSLLEPVDEPLADLMRRYARTHGPFTTREPAARFDLPPSQVEPFLHTLQSSGRIVRGEIRPGGAELDWCDADVLRRLKRRTLAKLRHEVAPVDAEVLGRFLPRWHGLDGKRGGAERVEEAIAQLEGLALPWSSLSRVIFPKRVIGFRLEMLDMLSASGSVVWIGAGPLGMNDGKVLLYRRERVKDLLEPPPPYEPESRLHETILEHLQTRGASFSMELQRLSPETKPQELQDALWDLVWAGQITNDTFLPLQSLGRRPRRPRRPGLTKKVEGRWSMVRDLLDDDVTHTERAYARAQMLLERYGIVSREAAAVDDLPGGFKGIYGVLKAMEETGRLRRGYYVEGLSATQFAYPGAVERLRASRYESDAGEVLTLAAVDPANPWGSLLPWPETRSNHGQRARRVPGAWILLWEGTPALHLHVGGRAVLTFEPMENKVAATAVIEGLIALTGHTRSSLRLARIDGEPAVRSPLGPQLLAAGFFADYNDLVFPYQP
jgi:ATP-dependent Lhr-like helicase